jgi:putative transposase
VRLRREGWRVNHKKVERIYYRDEGLSLRRRPAEEIGGRPPRRPPPTDAAGALLCPGFCA